MMTEWMVVITMNGLWCWFVESGTMGHAVKAAEGIVEAGGNVWDTPDGHAPDADSYEYEVAAVIDVKEMDEQQRKQTFEKVRAEYKPEAEEE